MQNFIQWIVKYLKTKIFYDISKPDGSPRRNSNNKKAKEEIGFEAKVNLDEGLKRTIDWYKKTFKH